jgi:hypothetical protein
MPLLEEVVFSVLCLLTAISIRILKTITKVIENIKEPAHFRILNLTPHIYGSAIQPVSEFPDLFLNNAWSTEHRGGVEDSGTGSYLLNCCRAVAWISPEGLHPVPVGIVPCGHRLADARRAIAETDVAIALARIAEFCESMVFEGFDYGGAWRFATRFCIA